MRDRIRWAALPRPVCAYIYDIAALRARADAVRAALPTGASLLYAVKANGHPAVVRALAEACDGLEVASGGELRLALAAGARRVVFGGPGKTDDELVAALDAGAQINAESVHELRRIAALAAARQGGAARDVDRARGIGAARQDGEAGAARAARDGGAARRVGAAREDGAAGTDGALQHLDAARDVGTAQHVGAARAAGAPPEVVLRVNRAGSALTGSHTMTGDPTPFGIDEAQLGDAFAVPGVRIVGFHLHAVSNNPDGAAHAAFVTDALRWSAAAAAAYGITLRVVNVGGGFGVDYRSEAAAAHLNGAGAGRRLAVGGMDLSALRGIAVPDGVDLVFEPGRYLAADAGWYAAEVLDLKTTHGRTFAVLRGGTHHFRLPAAWGYSHPFGVVPVDDWPHPYPRPEVTGVEVDAVGELCTPRDVLARGRAVPRLRAGDILLFARAGAYGWDISHHDFLRHDPPRFVIIS